MNSAGKSALEYFRAIYPMDRVPGDHTTQIWLIALPGDHSRETGMESGVVQLPVFDGVDVIEFVDEWAGRRNLYYKAARFMLDAPGPQKAFARDFLFAWLDLDLAFKPEVAGARYIDMACDALDSLERKPSVIVSSGGGVQALWHFDKALLAGETEGHLLVEQLNHELARVFGGDTAQCHAGGGLRVPFSVNMNRTAKVSGAGGGAVIARVLRLEPDRTCVPQALLEELHGFGTKLSRTKDGAWSSVPAVLSKLERAHMAEARAQTGAGAKPRKTADEWADIKRAMVLKGGRKVAATKLVGWMVRRAVVAGETIIEDDIVDNVMALSVEAAEQVRAGGGAPQILHKGQIASIVSSIVRKHERDSAVRVAS